MVSIRTLTAALAALALAGLLACGTAYARSSGVKPPNADERETRIDSYLADYAEANHIPGLAVAVIDVDGVERHVLGEDGAEDPVSAETPFLIGSIAKSITATLVMHLEAAGELDLGDRVSDHLDYLPEGDPTIEQLLTHTAGFTAADGIAVADRSDGETGAIRRAVEDLKQSGTVGDYAYTSADYLVLGAVVEEVTGRPFADVLREQLLEPLGMDSSAAWADAAGELPPGHRLWWGRAVGYDPAHDESGTSYSGVVTTLEDLTTYTRAQFGLDDTIPAAIRKQMQRPHVESSRDHYGLGWSIGDFDGTRVVHHTGATPGFFTHVWMVPEDGIAVVLLANVYAESRAGSLFAGAEDIWRITRGEQPQPTGGDPLLTALPWILVGVALMALAVALLSRRRPVRRPLRLAAAAGCAVVVAALWLLPGVFGFDLRALRIWTPDAAWGLIAGLVLWGLAAVALLLPVRGARSRRTGSA